MGPLASAEFLKTIYEFNFSRTEKDAPAFVLYSDPSVPDRTEAILQRYQLNSFIAACTEFHLLTKHLPRDELLRQKYEVIDPLTLAKNVRNLS